MKINLTNYEAYLLDFAEGNLTPTQTTVLLDFLEEHPHLKSDLDSYEEIVINCEQKVDSRIKNHLLREEKTGLPITDYLMIAQAEGKITRSEKIQLAKIAAEDKSIYKDLALYHKIKLPKENILFPTKSELRKQDRKGVYWIQIVTSAAAAAILALMLFNLSSSERQYSPDSFSLKVERVNSDTKERLASSVKTFESIKEEQSVNPINSYLEKEVLELAELKESAKIPLIKKLDYSLNTSLEFDQEKSMESVANDYTQVAFLNDEGISENEDTELNKEFITVSEFAINKINSSLLNNKSVKETLFDELVKLSNEKLSLPKSKEGESQRFAINVGKFSYSNY